jgi:hypothetical protein
MDKVYRLFQKGEDPKSGEITTRMMLKSVITQPLNDETLPCAPVTILGAAYGGGSDIGGVDVSVDGGCTWNPADIIGPVERYAWRQWQYLWEVKDKGDYRILARASGNDGSQQPLNARWNVLGYGNNGVREHGISLHIADTSSE